MEVQSKKVKLSAMDFQAHVINKLDELSKQMTDNTVQIAANTVQTTNIVDRLDKLNGKVATLQQESNNSKSWIGKHDELEKVYSGIYNEKHQDIITRLDSIETFVQEKKATGFEVLANVDWFKLVKILGIIIIALGLITAGRFDLIGKILSLLSV